MTLKVKARAGIRVPREDNPRRYIEDEPVDVPESAYYLRRLYEGDLVNADAGTAATVADETSSQVKDVTSSKGTK